MQVHARVPGHVLELDVRRLQAVRVGAAARVEPPLEEHGMEATLALEGVVPHRLVVAARGARRRLEDDARVDTLVGHTGNLRKALSVR